METVMLICGAAIGVFVFSWVVSIVILAVDEIIDDIRGK